ncbi:ParA family protein, partial [Rhizobium sp. BK661]
MSLIYAVVSNKGGAGKTTLATLLAGEYALDGRRVLMVDADGRQNLAGWWKLCHAKGNVPGNIEVTIAATRKAVAETIDRYRDAFDVILVDAAGVDSVLQTTIIRSSDVVLSPVQP